MAGIPVNRTTLDSRIGTTIIALRDAFEQADHINQFLVNNPVTGTPAVDPLCSVYNYTADEAYAIRLVFQNFAADYTAQASNFQTASQMTGLD